MDPRTQCQPTRFEIDPTWPDGWTVEWFVEPVEQEPENGNRSFTAGARVAVARRDDGEWFVLTAQERGWFERCPKAERGRALAQMIEGHGFPPRVERDDRLVDATYQPSPTDERHERTPDPARSVAEFGEKLAGLLCVPTTRRTMPKYQFVCLTTRGHRQPIDIREAAIDAVEPDDDGMGALIHLRGGQTINVGQRMYEINKVRKQLRRANAKAAAKTPNPEGNPE